MLRTRGPGRLGGSDVVPVLVFRWFASLAYASYLRREHGSGSFGVRPDGLQALWDAPVMGLPLPTMVCPSCRRSGHSEKHCEIYSVCRWRVCECGAVFNTATGDGFNDGEEAKEDGKCP